MSELYLYIFLFVLVVGFCIWELWISRRNSPKNRHLCDIVLDDDGNKSSFNAVYSQYAGKIEAEYDSCSADLSDLFKNHRDEDFDTLPLETVALSYDCREELYSLAPGDRLYLLKELGIEGVEFKVFSEGRLIGKLSFSNSLYLEDLMNIALIKGVYVWKKSNFTLDLVIFYEYRDLCSFSCCSEPFRLKIEGKQPFTLYQN